MKCAVCKINDAEIDPYWGIIPCKKCRERQSKLTKPGGQIEFTSDSIKEGRKAHADDIEPQHIQGHLNKRWVDLYGKKRAKELGYSDREIKNASYVTNGAPGHEYYKRGN